jgi:hypothetical protein
MRFALSDHRLGSGYKLLRIHFELAPFQFRVYARP